MSVPKQGLSASAASILLALVLLVLWGAVAEVLLNARSSDLRRASDEASNIVAAVTQDIDRNLELYDLSIRGALEGVQNPVVMAADKQLRHLILFDRAATAPYLGQILVLDSSGAVIADSSSVETTPLNYADQDYFRIHAEQPNFGLFVSRPFTSRGDGTQFIALSRRITNRDGTFGGVVAGTLRLDYIRQLFRQMKLGHNGSLTLFRDDGTVVMREPYEPALIGVRQSPPHLFDLLRQAPDGEYQAKALLDGTERLYHYRRVGSLPLVQNVGLAIDDIFEQWWRRASIITSVVAVCCLVIVHLMLALRRELQRRSKAEAALMQLVEIDGLTGLANRRCLDRILAAEWQRAVDHDAPLGLLMVDADWFKAYNDTFGHAQGDVVLRTLADCLRAAAYRPGDLAARFGGEEFTLVLPLTDAAGALKVAERLRQAVAALCIHHPDSPVGHVTVSIGVASLIGRRDRNAADLVVAADEALYASKASGRNRTTVHKPVVVPLHLAS